MDESLDAIWKALSDPTRRSMLDQLRDGAMTTGALASTHPGLTRFAVMKHLRVLENVGLVVGRKEGRKRWNSLNAVPLKRVYDRWVTKYEDHWAGSLIKLKSIAEREDMGTKLAAAECKVAVVETGIEINASREKVFETFLNDAGEWFYESEASKKTGPVRIEPFVGGKFSIVYDNGDENLLAMVTLIKKNKELRLSGDYTMPNAFIANVTVKFTDEGSGVGGGCKVAIHHRMAGEFDDDLPAGFEEGWQDGLDKLKALVEESD